MTAKIKLGLGLALLVAAGAVGFGLRGTRLKQERRLAQQEQERLRAELARVQQRLAGAESDLNKKNKEVIVWREKTNGRKVNPSVDCRECRKQIQLGLEVEDNERGWWSFRDPDVFDGEPGRLTLTPKFWREVIPECPPLPDPPPKLFGGKRWRMEREVRLAVGLTGYEAEFDFSPLVLSGRRGQARLSLNSRLEFNRLDATLRGDLSAGLAFRW